MVEVELPKGWSIQPLKRLCQIVMGQSPHSSTYNTNHIGVPLIQGLADTADGITTPKVWTSEPTKVVPASTTLMSVRAPVGAVVRSATEVNLGRGMCGFLPYTIETRNFLYHSLVFSEPAWFSTSQGSTFTAVNKANVEEFVIALPDDPREQQIIAEALSDIDELVKNLRNLLFKTELIFTGLIENLLSPFGNQAEKQRLGDLVAVKTGSKNNQDKSPNGEYKFFVRSDEVERIDTFSYNTEAILIPGEGRIGEIFHYVNEPHEVHQRVYRISDPSRNINLKYLYWYLFKYFGAHAMLNTVKATVDSLRLPTFLEFRVGFPAINEQMEIARILDSCDEQIRSLRSEIMKYELVKQGMMSDLLTGKVRLV